MPAVAHVFGSLARRLRVSRRQALALCAILVLATGARLWGINHSVNTDENKVVIPSMKLAKGEQTPLLYPRGSYYPHLYHYIVSGVFLPAAIMHPDRGFDNPYNNMYLLLGRVTTAIFGILTVLLLFLVSRRFVDARTALVAALFLAVLPAHVKYSHYAHVDVPLAFFILLTLWSAARVWETGDARWYALTGLLVGFSGAVQYTGLAAGIALVCAHIARTWRRQPVIRHVLRPAFLLALLCIPAGFFLGSPYAVISWKETLETYRTLSLRAATGDVGYTRPNIFWPLTTRTPDWGLPFTSAGILWEFNPLLCVAAALGFTAACMKKQWKIAVLIGGVALVLYFSLSGYVRMSALKRYLILAPFVSLLAAYALTELPRLFPRMRSILVPTSLGILLGIIATSGWRVAAFDAAYARGSTHPQAVAWAMEHLPAGATVLQHGPIYLLPPDSTRFRILSMKEVYANFHPEDPEARHDRARPLDDWVKQENVDIIYLDARITDRYYDPTVNKLYPETAASYRAFYEDIRTRGKLLYEVSPVPWKIAGPRVEIYDVRHVQ